MPEDPKYVDGIKRWWTACRDGAASQRSDTDELPNMLRSGVSLAGVGFNLSTALLQVVGITQTLAYLGPKWSARGMSDFLTMRPAGAYKWVGAKSEMMAARMRTQFRELAEIQSRLQGTTGAWRDKMMRAAYYPLTVMQMIVDLPTWIGAYQKALYEGNEEAVAVAIADRAVINAQGSGRHTDLSAMERGNAWQKLFTVFYTFFNTAFNLAVVTGKTQTGMRRAANLLMILLMQPVIEAFIKGAVEGIGGDDDDWMEKMPKELGKNVLSFNLGLLVGVRELSWVLGDFGYQGPSGLRKINDTGRAIRAWERAVEEDEWDEATMKATVSAIGVWTGLPVTPINRAISGGNALLNDETDNPLAIIMGAPSK